MVRANHDVVAIDGGGDADPVGARVVAGLDETGAAGSGLNHGLALTLVEDSWVASLTAGHGGVVLVLCEAVGETVADGDGLEVDVAVLVRHDFGSKLGDVVAAILSRLLATALTV